MSQEELGDLLEKAYAELERGRTASARKIFERARKLAPEDRDVVILEVDVLLEEAEEDEQVERAIEVLEAAVERDPDDAVLAALLASHLVELFGDYAGALPLLEGAAEAVAEDEPEQEPDLTEHREFLVDVLLLLSECRTGCRDPRGALAAAERARDLDPDDPAGHLAVASAHYDLCDLEAARRALDEAFRLERELPEGYWLLGRIETAGGDETKADRAFSKAVAINPTDYAPPVRITEDELVAMIEAGIAELPEQVRSYMENVAIVVEDFPALDRLTDNDPPLSPGSLGLFEGTPPAEESTLDPWSVYPRQITLFRRNLEIDARDRDDLKELAVTTLVHEVGHFLGLDEDDLEERGLA